jgi:hypothetical protein
LFEEKVNVVKVTSKYILAEDGYQKLDGDTGLNVQQNER